MKIKVVSWNIWQDYHLKEVITFLKQRNADIIGLQEVIEKNGTNTAATIAKELNYSYAYYQAIDKTKLGFPQGNAILSNYPIKESQSYFLSDKSVYQDTPETEPRIAIKAIIPIGEKPLNIFTTHLAYAPKFQNSSIRDRQVENLLKLLPAKNTVLMGDFNAHPDSIYIQKIQKNMRNVDSQNTQPTWTIYPFEYDGFKETQLKHRLDYIFISKDLQADSFTIKQSKGSDHLPIVASIEI